MMKKRLGVMMTGLMLLSACIVMDDGLGEDTEEAEGIEPEIVAENLDEPWSIARYEDTFYISERTGSMVHVDGESSESYEMMFSDEVSDAAEAGMLGFVLAPDFSETDEAYAYYTYENDDGQFNRLVTMTLTEDAWTEDEILLDEIPSGQVHHGGRLAIGPDDHLYVTTGDAADEDLAQDTDSLGGNILRMTLDGEVPPDNPFDDSYIYSYGHRNPQGLAWDDADTLYSSEHGDDANDEINLIEAGGNYGWPVIEGTEEEEGMITPLFTSGDDTWAPSGMSYYDESLYVAALRGSALMEFDLNSEEERAIVTDLGRIRDVMTGEDHLYFISNNTDGRGDPDEADDRLYRIPLSDLPE